MDERQIYEFKQLGKKLDRIIELLKLRNSIYQARNEPKANSHIECECLSHKPGESTSGWLCPTHGQRF